jgi:hypothetical protein
MVLFIVSKGGRTHLSTAERRVVATKVLPSIQRLKTMLLLDGSRLSVIFQSGMLEWADSWAGVGLWPGGLRLGKCFPYFFPSDLFLFIYLFSILNF